MSSSASRPRHAEGAPLAATPRCSFQHMGRRRRTGGSGDADPPSCTGGGRDRPSLLGSPTDSQEGIESPQNKGDSTDRPPVAQRDNRHRIRWKYLNHGPCRRTVEAERGHMRDWIAHPEVMPILSPGRHRSPRRGACFMEFASYLAGERWSDHPACTHGTLAHLARLVNDRTSEAGRARLTHLIPTVVGLTSEDPMLDVLLALRAASAALPIAAEERQRSQAGGLRVLLSVLAQRDDEFAAGSRDRAAAALRAAPAADAWAIQFIEKHG